MAQNIQFLIQVGGHRPGEVMDYSIGQLQAYAELAVKQQRTQLAELAGAVRVGFHADQNEFAKQIASWLK